MTTTHKRESLDDSILFSDEDLLEELEEEEEEEGGAIEDEPQENGEVRCTMCSVKESVIFQLVGRGTT